MGKDVEGERMFLTVLNMKIWLSSPCDGLLLTLIIQQADSEFRIPWYWFHLWEQHQRRLHLLPTLPTVSSNFLVFEAWSCLNPPALSPSLAGGLSLSGGWPSLPGRWLICALPLVETGCALCSPSLSSTTSSRLCPCPSSIRFSSRSVAQQLSYKMQSLFPVLLLQSLYYLIVPQVPEICPIGTHNTLIRLLPMCQTLRSQQQTKLGNESYANRLSAMSTLPCCRCPQITPRVQLLAHDHSIQNYVCHTSWWFHAHTQPCQRLVLSLL